MPRTLCLAVFLGGFALPAFAQTMPHAHVPGMTHPGAPAAVAQPGQSAFAAIAEIVALLRADPSTDWSRVDISALRAHLVDMEMLMMAAEVTSEPLPGGLRMTLPTTGPAGGAIARMVPAHAPVLAGETGWNSQVRTAPDAVVWTVTSPDHGPAIRALGFFGLMATGDHHPAHHLALATGNPMH